MNEFCVIHDKEFVAKAKQLGLSEDSLDRVIYDYRKNHQGDNPSDDYIRAQFEGTNVVSLESYDNAITVWQDKYSSDILFATSQELIRAKQEALKYFEKEAIKDFVNSDGKFVLRVARPTVSNTELPSVREMEQIKSEAIANGTFMLAPNGRQSNLSEQQWLQVRTKAFKAWFGDWINDPANASKVLDENGEPLVVYHHTDNPNLTEFSSDFENYFTREGGTKSAIFFDENPTGTLGRKYDVPVFLNIRDLKEYNETKEQLHRRGTTYRQIVNESAAQNPIDGGVHMKDFDDNKMEHQSVWITHNPNQSKSATDNIGTFSSATNNLFANRNFDQYYKHLFEGLQRRVKGKEAAIKQINAVDGTNFGYRNGKFYMNTHPTLHGVRIEGINKEMPIRRLIARDELMNYLVDKFQLNYEELKDDEFNRRFGTAIVNNAIVIGDTVYVRQSRVMDLNNEQFIEEFLHPTVHAVAGNNRELFNKLLAEAKKDFSLLDSQIKALYNDLPQEVQDEELVTQVLAKYVNKEISDKGTNTRKLVDYIKQFFEWIAEQFQDLFGEFTMGRNQLPVVSGKDIRDVLNFDEFAQIINIRNLRFGDTLHDHIGFNNRTIIYNEGQQNAINQVTAFINDKLAGKPTAKQYFTIEGEAGTGKTTIINAVVSELVKANKRAMVHVSAVSHKATTNIYNKVKSAIPAGSHVALEAHTIAGELGAEMDEESGEFTIKEDKFNPAYIDQADIIFVDEASMINEEVFNYINEKAKKDSRLAIVFLGDLGQLPPIRTSSYYQKHPVNANADSPVFNEEITTKVTLTERVRQGEASPILEVSHRLHEAGIRHTTSDEEFDKAINGTTKDAVSDQGAILYKKGGNRGSFLEMIEDAFKVSRDSNNPFHIKIVSYTNDSVSTYNQIIRSLMFPGETRPLVPKDILTFYTESKIIGNKKEKIHNSEDFSVVNVEALEDEYGVTYYRTTLTDGDREVVTDLVLRSDTENYQKWQTVKAGLWNAWRNETDLFKKRGLKQKAIDYSYNGFGEADYGYAITSHKAQGSTYDISVVDQANILAVKPPTYKQKIQSLYTAVTRASNVVVIVGDVDNGSTQNVEALNTRITTARFGESPVTEMPNTMPAAQEVADFAAEEGDILGQQQQTVMPTNLELGNSGTALLNNPNGVPANYSEARSIIPSNPEERTYQNSMAGHQLQSGGAYGSDTLWDVIGSREFGLEIYDINHYRDAGNVILASTLRGAPFNRTARVEDLSIARREIKRLLGIDLPDTIQGNLKARNYYQVSNAEVVVAIATFDNPIEGNTAWMNAHVNGGTDIAVQLGIAMNKPVYVFDPVQNKWAVYKADAVSEKTGGFVPSDAPSLYEYKSFAGVGTRDIESYILKDKNGNWVPNPRYLGEKARLNAIRAIREVYSNTVLKRANMTTAKAPEVVPVEDTPINIYAGTGENVELSNFAIRPIDSTSLKDNQAVDDISPNPVIPSFKSVEQAFQWFKFRNLEEGFLHYLYDNDIEEYKKVSAEVETIQKQILNTTNGKSLRILGNTRLHTKYGEELKGDFDYWDTHSPALMKALIKASFEQNPEALQKLLATGNVTLTHTQDKSKWSTEFPRILMEVREELRKEETTPEPSKEEKQITSDQYVDDVKPAEPTYKQVAEEKVRNAEIYDWEDGDTEFLGYQLKYVDSIELRDGAEVGARNPHDGTILLNLDALRVKFEEKAWRTPDRSNPNIPDFQTFQEMMTWVLLHEVGHDFKERFKGEDNTAYESRVNEWANLQVKRKLQREAQELTGVGNQTLQLFQVTALENKGTKYTGMNTITVAPRKVNKATRREALNKVLFELPISSLVTFAGTPTIEMFQTIRLMREVGMNPTNTTVPKDLFGDESLIRAARAAKLEITEDGKVRMPAFIKGLTEEELNIIEQSKVFIESSLFRASELNTLAKMSVFKVSEFITMLQSQESANQKLLGDDFKDVNFVGMSRIDIIDKVGLYRLFDIVKERVFNSSVNDEMAFSAQNKADLIYDNFEAFMQMGFSSLINMEEISLDGFQEVKSEINETIDPEDEQSIQEIFGSSAEHWQVGFRQISAYSSLSQLIKRTIEKLYVLDKNGNFKYNEFGLAETVNPQDAVTQILNWVQYAETLDDMVELLKQHVEQAPWLNYLINDNTDPNNPFTQAVGGLGKLVGDDEQFKSQFFSNFKKYFQKYSITYKDQDGKTVIKIINEHGVADEEFAAVNARYESYDLGHFPLRNTDGTVNTKKLEELKSLGTELSKLKALDANALKLIKQIAEILTINSDTDDNLRLTLTGNDVENISKKVRFIVEAFERVSKDSTINPFSGKASIVNDIKAIIITLNRIQNDTLESVSYEAGKMYYSYVMPSYLNKLVGKLQGHVFPRVINGTLETQEQAYQRFLQSEYGQYKWFYDQKNGKWRNYILQKLATDLSVRRGFDHKASLHFLGTSYADKSPAEYAASLIQEFLYDDNKKWAWYRIPTMSNKPSEEYIKFLRFHEGYMDAISNLMVNLFIQELDRIATVTTRNKVLPKDQLLKNFDKNGLKFQFLDFLEEYRDAKTEKGKTDFGALLRQALAGEINPTDGNAYNDLIQGFKNALRENTEEHFQTAVTKWKNEGFINDAYESAYVALGNTPQDREDTLREYFWNDMFMTTQILELTITDIAYYKDTEDLQKRLAQLHAPGMRGNILAKDIATGKLVTDGFSRTFYIKDDVVKADVVENLRAVEKQMRDKAQTQEEKNQVTALFANIIHAFEETNVADAQAYSSPTSYRKKMHIFGKWDQAQEDLYNKIVKGDGTITDLEILWQPLKPFVYSQISKSSPGLYDKIKVGVQNKNSEYLLIMADAILRGNQRPNRLSAIFDVMEESSHTEGQINDHGIDTVQFESTVKAGLTGIININDDAFVDLSSVTVDDIKKVITDKIYTTDEQGNQIYNEAYVHSIPFEDYAMQQEVPAHFKGEQQQGSQDRILGLSDTPNTLPDGTPAYLEVNGERITVEEAKKRYFKAISDNIEDSTAEIIRRFKLDNLDPKMRNIALSRMLRDEILRDSRFDSEMLWACSVNKDGDFNIPLSDPTQSNRIQQLLNSIIKNTIDKQKIAGGPVVQVSNYGTSNALAVRFQDKNSNILLSRREFEEIRAGRMTVKYSEKRQSVTEENGITVLRGKFSLPVKEVKDEDGNVIRKEPYQSYEEYLKDRQYTFAYLEAYAPLLSEQFVADFADESGSIDMEKVERVAPDLLKMIAYRIPTEAKYSILPIKIIGFLPASAGEGIMLPAEITTMTGSDFDVDKMYIMRHLLKRTEGISEKKLADAYDEFIKQGNEDTLENRAKFRNEHYNELTQPVYSRFEKGRQANNDTILDIQWANLTSPAMLTQVWTPGNFDEPKKYGYLIQALSVRLTELDDYKKSLVEANMSPKDIEENLQQRALEIYNELKGLSTNSLKEIGYQKKNLIYADTQMDFHRQNMVAAKLIGVFAQANVSHAFIGLKDCEGNPCTLNLTSLANDGAKEDLAFVLNNKIMEGNVYVDRYMNFDGVRESALLASLLAASVDAVKDPVLNLMNINIDTVNVAVSLIRLGFGIETAALLLSQPYIKQILVEFNKVKNVTNLRDYIAFSKKKLMDAENFNSENLWLNRFRYTDEFFVKCFGSMNNMDRIVILDLMEKLLRISDAFSMITHMTRYNSITAAVGPFASDTMDMKLKDEDFYTSPLITDSLKAAVDNPILKAFRDNAYRVEEMLLGRNIIQASPSFQRILKTLKQRIGYLSSDIAEDFTDFFMSYYMQLGNTQVFDQSDERRKYMLTQYATDFLELKTKYPDNALLKAIHFNAANNNEQYPFLSLNLRGRNNDEVQAAKAGWTELLNDDEKAALDLAEYCFFRGGMGFSPKTFTRIMPNAVKAALSSYIAKLNNYSDSMFTDAQVTRMINQFILHNVGENGLIRLSPLKANNSILDLNMIFTPADINSLLERKRVNTEAEPVVQKGQPKPVKVTMYTGLHTVAIADKLYTVYIDVSPTGARTIQIVDILGGRREGLELNTTQDFPRTVFEQQEREAPQTPVTPAADDTRYDMISALMFNLYDADELAKLDTIANVASDEMTSFVYDIQTRYEKAKGRPTTDQEKIRLYNSKSQVAKVLSQLKTLMPNQYAEVLNKANQTLNEINLCS